MVLTKNMKIIKCILCILIFCLIGCSKTADTQNNNNQTNQEIDDLYLISEYFSKYLSENKTKIIKELELKHDTELSFSVYKIKGDFIDKQLPNNEMIKDLENCDNSYFIELNDEQGNSIFLICSIGKRVSVISTYKKIWEEWEKIDI